MTSCYVYMRGYIGYVNAPSSIVVVIVVGVVVAVDVDVVVVVVDTDVVVEVEVVDGIDEVLVPE